MRCNLKWRLIARAALVVCGGVYGAGLGGLAGAQSFDSRCESPAFMGQPQNRSACLKACEDAQFRSRNTPGCKGLVIFAQPTGRPVPLPGLAEPERKKTDSRPEIGIKLPDPEQTNPFPACVENIPALVGQFRDISSNISKEAQKYTQLRERHVNQVRNVCQLGYDDVLRDFRLSLEADKTIHELDMNFGKAEQCQEAVGQWLDKEEFKGLDPEVRENYKKQIAGELESIKAAVRDFRTQMKEINDARQALETIYRLYEKLCGKHLDRGK
jgi:hypothetical protein